MSNAIFDAPGYLGHPHRDDQDLQEIHALMEQELEAMMENKWRETLSMGSQIPSWVFLERCEVSGSHCQHCAHVLGISLSLMVLLG